MEGKLGVGFIKRSKEEVIYKNNDFGLGSLGKFLVNFLNNAEDSKLKKDFIKVVDYVYNIHSLDELKDYTPYDRYYRFTHLENNNYIEEYAKGISIDTSIDFNLSWIEFCEKDNKDIIENKTTFDKFFELVTNEENYRVIDPLKDLYEIPYFFVGDKGNILFLMLMEVLTQNVIIRQCKNCNKYFIPVNRSDEVYCSNEYKDGKTCKQIGFWQIKKKKYEEDEFARLYRNTYQQKLLRVKRNPDNKEYVEDFEKFKEGAKHMKEAVLSGEKTEDDFKKWLIEVKNK